MHDNSSQRSVTTKVIIVNYCKSYWMLCVCSNFSTMLQSLNRASSANYTLFGACSNACAVERLHTCKGLLSIACILICHFSFTTRICLYSFIECCLWEFVPHSTWWFWNAFLGRKKYDVDLFIGIRVNNPPFGESHFRVNHSLPLCEGWKTWEIKGKL